MQLLFKTLTANNLESQHNLKKKKPALLIEHYAPNAG